MNRGIWTPDRVEKFSALADGTRSANEITEQMNDAYNSLGLNFSRNTIMSKYRRINLERKADGQKLLRLSDSKGGFYEGHKHNHKVPVRKKAASLRLSERDVLKKRALSQQIVSEREDIKRFHDMINDRLAATRPSFKLPVDDAVQNLIKLFEKNAQYERYVLGYSTCHYDVGGHACGLALEKADKLSGRCAFHQAVGQYAALELTAYDIYRGSPLFASMLYPLWDAQKTKVFQPA